MVVFTVVVLAGCWWAATVADRRIERGMAVSQ